MSASDCTEPPAAERLRAYDAASQKLNQWAEGGPFGDRVSPAPGRIPTLQ